MTCAWADIYSIILTMNLTQALKQTIATIRSAMRPFYVESYFVSMLGSFRVCVCRLMSYGIYVTITSKNKDNISRAQRDSAPQGSQAWDVTSRFVLTT